jgi:hypothetical protein
MQSIVVHATLYGVCGGELQMQNNWMSSKCNTCLL